MYLRKGQKCDLETLTEIYGDESVAATILASAEENKTVSRIESGALTLPEPPDAFEHHQRKHWSSLGLSEHTQDVFINNPQIHGMFTSLEQRLLVLESRKAAK